MAPQLAWIGLGNIGRGTCKNLVEKGNLDKPLVIFNRTRARADELSAKLGPGKTRVADSMADAVGQADIVFICLGDDAAITSSFDTILKGGNDVKGKLFVDCSTIHPDTTNAVAKSVAGAGARFVAAPVFGAAAMAEGGQLVFVLAGAAADVDAVLPYTKGVMGRESIVYADQAPGQATLMKIIGNTFILNMTQTLSEGHTVAEKTGLGAENLHRFVSTMFPGPFTAYSGRMKAFDFCEECFEPLFHVDLAQKDARHALSLAESSGTKMRAVEVASERLAHLKQLRPDNGDLAGMYGAVRVESGLPYGPKDA